MWLVSPVGTRRRVGVWLNSFPRRVTRWDASSRGASPPSHPQCMVGCHGRAGHLSTGASVSLLAVHANCNCLFFSSLVLSFLLAGL